MNHFILTNKWNFVFARPRFFSPELIGIGSRIVCRLRNGSWHLFLFPLQKLPTCKFDIVAFQLLEGVIRDRIAVHLKINAQMSSMQCGFKNMVIPWSCCFMSRQTRTSEIRLPRLQNAFDPVNHNLLTERLEVSPHSQKLASSVPNCYGVLREWRMALRALNVDNFPL